MPRLAGVRLRPRERVYTFDTGGLELRVGDRVVVETEQGPGLGWVTWLREEAELPSSPPKPILRPSQPQDLEQAASLRARAEEVLKQAREAVAKRGLPMKLLNAQYNLDASRLTIYFSAPDRVDFRELVRELASLAKARVELHQLGPRDEAKCLGGIGPCGLPTCCSRWLTGFAPVSLRMAKEQELSPNPEKLSGLCGRLLCCLGYELEHYRQLLERLPKVGQTVTTPLGPASVIARNALKETVVVELESQAQVELPLSQIASLATS